MSVSGSRAAVDINLEEFEKRLRAAGAQHLGAEDPLSELARLVETTRPQTAAPALAPAQRSAVEAAPRPAVVVAPPQLPRVSEPAFKPVPKPEPPAAPLAAAALRPSLEEADARYTEAEAEPEAPAPFVEPEDAAEFRSAAALPAPEPSSRKWVVTVSALAVAGVAMLGAAFALRSGLPSLPGASKAPPFIAAAQGPTRVQPPTDATVAAAPETGGPLLKDANPSAPVKVVSSEEQPVDIAAQAAAAKAAAPAGAQMMKGAAETPLVAPTAANPPPTFASQFPDPKPVRTVSLRPDGTPVPASALNAGPPAAAIPPPPPAAPAAKPAAPVAPQASTPKIELPTKLNGKSSARVVVGKTDTTAPTNGDAAAPTQLGAKPAKPAKAHEAAIEPKAADAAPAQTATAEGGGWSVQLAAPRSESEAKATAAKLNEKYGSALNGAPIGVHKANVNGDTIYRLRVGGLSKADAAALCARLKGEGGQCFVAK